MNNTVPKFTEDQAQRHHADKKQYHYYINSVLINKTAAKF